MGSRSHVELKIRFGRDFDVIIMSATRSTSG
jgi:hypothetical protein